MVVLCTAGLVAGVGTAVPVGRASSGVGDASAVGVAPAVAAVVSLGGRVGIAAVVGAAPSPLAPSLAGGLGMFSTGGVGMGVGLAQAASNHASKRVKTTRGVA